MLEIHCSGWEPSIYRHINRHTHTYWRLSGQFNIDLWNFYPSSCLFVDLSGCVSACLYLSVFFVLLSLCSVVILMILILSCWSYQLIFSHEYVCFYECVCVRVCVCVCVCVRENMVVCMCALYMKWMIVFLCLLEEWIGSAHFWRSPWNSSRRCQERALLATLQIFSLNSR